MEVTPKHIELALDVRRGLMRLRDLKEDASVVRYVLDSTSDAKLAQIASEQHPHIRSRAWGGARPRGSLSTP